MSLKLIYGLQNSQQFLVAFSYRLWLKFKLSKSSVFCFHPLKYLPLLTSIIRIFANLNSDMKLLESDHNQTCDHDQEFQIASNRNLKKHNFDF